MENPCHRPQCLKNCRPQRHSRFSKKGEVNKVLLSGAFSVVASVHQTLGCILTFGMCNWWCLPRSQWTSMMMMQLSTYLFASGPVCTTQNFACFWTILPTRSHIYSAKYLWPWKAKQTLTENRSNGKNAQIMKKFSFGHIMNPLLTKLIRSK